MFAAYESLYAVALAYARALFYAIFEFGIRAAKLFLLLEYAVTSWIVTVTRRFVTAYWSVKT